MEGDFNKLSSNYNKLKNLLPNVLGASIPAVFAELGDFTINGVTTITTKNIDAKLYLDTDIGIAKSDLKIVNVNSIENASYVGNLQLENFNLGQLLSDQNLGQTTLNLDIDGNGFNKENLKSNLKGNITTITYNDYQYQDIVVNGQLCTQSTFNGKLSC